MVQIFKRFYAAYVDAISNPFYTMSTVRSASVSPHSSLSVRFLGVQYACSVRLR